MRAVFGVLGLLITLVVVALLAKKQMGVLTLPPASISAPIAGASAVVPVQQLPQQIGKTVENVMQQARPMPDDK